MPSRHPDPRALERLALGDAQGTSLLRLLEHVAGCSPCRSDFSGLALARAERGATTPVPESSYDQALRRVAVRCRRIFLGLRSEQRSAEWQIRHLLSLPDEHRRRLLATSPRLRRYALAREILLASERAWSDDPKVAEDLAKLALLVADHLSSRTHGRALLEDLRAEIWAFVANARRIRSDYRGATEAFDRAEGHGRHGTGDPAEVARLVVLHSTFLRNLGELEAARNRLEHAVALYGRVGDRHLTARSLISMSILQGFMGNADLSLSLLDRATRWLEPGREDRLLAGLPKNRALILAQYGDRTSIRRSLTELDPGRESGRLDRLRTIWARGLVLERLDQPDEAERSFAVARRGFVRAQIQHDVALLDLDLGRLNLSMGRTEEARRRAVSAFPVFASRGLHGDTLRALDLFRRAGGLA